jgi:hypothetical protein
VSPEIEGDEVNAKSLADRLGKVRVGSGVITQPVRDHDGSPWPHSEPAADLQTQTIARWHGVVTAFLQCCHRPLPRGLPESLGTNRPVSTTLYQRAPSAWEGSFPPGR